MIWQYAVNTRNNENNNEHITFMTQKIILQHKKNDDEYIASDDYPWSWQPGDRTE
jgi:hypothetical protein